MVGSSYMIYYSVYANTLLLKSAVHCLQRLKISNAELCGRLCKCACVGRVGSCDISRLAIKIKILQYCFRISNAFLD